MRIRDIEWRDYDIICKKKGTGSYYISMVSDRYDLYYYHTLFRCLVRRKLYKLLKDIRKGKPIKLKEIFW